jgi:hypothetical protein
MATFKILGFSDEITTCDKCNKSELKGTYLIEDNETGEHYYYGSTCVKKQYNVKQSEINHQVQCMIQRNRVARKQAKLQTV